VLSTSERQIPVHHEKKTLNYLYPHLLIFIYSRTARRQTQALPQTEYVISIPPVPDGGGTELSPRLRPGFPFVLSLSVAGGTVPFFSDLGFYWTNLCLFKDLNHRWCPQLRVLLLREPESVWQPTDMCTSEAGLLWTLLY